MSKITKEQELAILFDVFADQSYEEWDGHRQVWRMHPALSKEKFIKLVQTFIEKDNK